MRRIVNATLALAVVLLAGCATTQTRTDSAADRLESSADAFAAGVCSEPKADCSSDARAFADQAHEFRQTLDSAGERQVVSSFEDLWKSYHKLRDQVDHLHDSQLQAGLEPITKAFADVQRRVKMGYSDADPALLVSGGYFLDPIYN
jgi:hypothetical protein